MIVPRLVLDSKYPGGRAAYEADAPNGTFCADDHLTRIGFMTPADVSAWLHRLTRLGFVVHDGSKFVDLAVVDQHQGPTAPCPWLDMLVHFDGFSVVSLVGTNPDPVAVPRGWTPAQSKSLSFVPNAEVASTIVPLTRAGHVETFLDFRTGKEVFIGRTTETT